MIMAHAFTIHYPDPGSPHMNCNMCIVHVSFGKQMQRSLVSSYKTEMQIADMMFIGLNSLKCS